MKLDPLLNKAAYLAKKRDYEAAFKILKDEEDRYNGSFKYYYLFGIICLHSGYYTEAHEYLQYAKRIKYNDISVLLGLAVLYLKRPNTVMAVDYYLDVLELDPQNKIAIKALEIIRKHSSAEALSDWMSPDNLAKFFPPVPVKVFERKKLVIFISAIVIGLVLAFGIFMIVRKPLRPERPTAEFILSRQERNEPVQVGGYYRYILTSSQALSNYERALSLFSSYRDEAAKLYINRILESNASEGLKSRARLLFENMTVPGFDTFNRSDNPAYSDVKNEPGLYRNVHVIWRGMATNIEITDNYTTFDFLVGYDTRRTLDGIIPVYFNKPVAINGDRPLEVLGRIVLSASYSDFMLEGVAIHQSGRLEN